MLISRALLLFASLSGKEDGNIEYILLIIPSI